VNDMWMQASACNNSACVQVRRSKSGVELRDSKNPGAEPKRFSDEEWAAFITGAKNGEFDL
jgi:hypothetical protein